MASDLDDDQHPWDALSDEELASMRAPTPAEASQVDALLLAASSTRWQKVARVIATVMNDFERRFPDMPFEFLSYRVQELGGLGTLEVAGDPFRPRYSEIRLHQPAGGASE
ncbi:DUF3658 domain-containing protein [Roseateles sp. UC29_93]|uniref:DUF3658 domain-containing protein n=1 Tax=Roseateles sp. UC29_93 TaxID=3350177 RepID=UPI00366CFC93